MTWKSFDQGTLKFSKLFDENILQKTVHVKTNGLKHVKDIHSGLSTILVHLNNIFGHLILPTSPWRYKAAKPCVDGTFTEMELAGGENYHHYEKGNQQRAGICMEWPLASLGWRVVPGQVGCQATSSQTSANWLTGLMVPYRNKRCQDCWLVQLEQPGFVPPQAHSAVGAAQPHPKPGGHRRVKRILLQPMFPSVQYKLKGVRAAVYHLWSAQKIHKNIFLRFDSIQPVLELSWCEEFLC